MGSWMLCRLKRLARLLFPAVKPPCEVSSSLKPLVHGAPELHMLASYVLRDAIKLD